jgi:two-component system cell cycle sensor histidine kinase/response regulator CckA
VTRNHRHEKSSKERLSGGYGRTGKQTGRAADRTAHAESCRSIIDSAPFGIYRRTKSGKLIMVNNAMVQLLGYGRAKDVLALDFLRDIHSGSRDFSKLLTLGRKHPGSPRDAFETQFRRKDGILVTVRLNEERIRASDGSAVFHQGFVEDVTARRETERQLELTQKMSSVGQLAGVVAHDFNNALNLIGVYAELLAERSISPAKTRDYALEILEATRRGAALTQQLLTLSRQQAAEPASIVVNELLEEFGKTLPWLLGKQVDVKIVTNKRPLTVRIDRGRWEQIILNLVINARDAMPNGGLLMIEMDALEIPLPTLSESPVSPMRYVQLTVSDTGVGMDESTLLRIFEPFFTTKESGRGTGLGLTVVHEIVHQNGGSISVSSRVGNGTRFRILLPQMDVSAAQGDGRQQP